MQPLAAQEMLLYMKEQVAEYKIPKAFFILPELPKTATGKLIRNRDMLYEHMRSLILNYGVTTMTKEMN
ncbi:acyl-CoA synthetase [compost metagenome]